VDSQEQIHKLEEDHGLRLDLHQHKSAVGKLKIRPSMPGMIHHLQEDKVWHRAQHHKALHGTD
jgi:hypothetical protein